MKLKDNYKVRSIAGENVLIMQGTTTPMSDNNSDMTRIISLNSTSLMLWSKLKGKEFETADVAALLVEKYGIENEVAERDAAAWVEKLDAYGLI